MISYLIWYGIFALATGITSYISIYRPVLVLIRDEYGGAATTDYPLLTALVLILFSTLSAPIMLKRALTGIDEEIKAEIFNDLIGDKEK